MNPLRAFFNGFFIGLFIFFLATVIATHLLSDCGLPAILGVSACADNIVRVGFPFKFYEEGGFAFHRDFNLPFLILDLFIGLDMAVFIGFMMYRYEKRYPQQ